MRCAIEIHWLAIIQLATGTLLSVIIGIEREFQQKPAGVRTCALVGLGATLFTVVSRNGEWLLPGLTITQVDGSRVAAQIVSGIGFLGAGLIFVRRDAVRGLTTAACIWVVAAIGMAAGAGLIDLAVSATLVYLLVVVGALPLRRRLPHSNRGRRILSVTYRDGRGVLRQVMSTLGDLGVGVENLQILAPEDDRGRRLQTVRLEVVANASPIPSVIQEVSELEHVHEVGSRTIPKHGDG
ncbi:MAG: MgtC/SapB family protein [Propionibacteriaceae bacterium]|nr:MgtC/SapB family protein [Propionibacteriaceae bacterium]